MKKQKIDIFPIVEQLENAKEKIHKLLKDFTNKGLSDKENIAFSVLEAVLQEIGKGLYNAAVAYTGEEDMKFYFWPGYTTLSEKRVLIKSKLTHSDKTEAGMFTGIGFIKGEPFYDCPSSLYYDAVLAEMKQAEYVGPTTHEWKRQQHDDVRIQLGDGTAMKILLIECGNRNQSYADKSFFHIKFNKNKIDKVVDIISPDLSINSTNLIVEGDKFIDWPLNGSVKKLGLTKEKERDLKAVQKLVYPIWFAATFSELLHNSANKVKAEKWLSRIKSKLTQHGYEKLVNRIDLFQSFEKEYLTNNINEYKSLFFSHWYSIFFDTTDQKQELGSAMILCDRALPKEYLFFISPWLKHIYGLMRMEDYALAVKKNQWKENFTKLHHSQIRYFEALKVYVESSNLDNNQKKSILLYKDILEGFLEVAKEIDNLDAYVKSKGEAIEINISEEVADSIDTMKLLFTNKKVALRSFKLRDSVFDAYKTALSLNSLFQGNFKDVNNIIINSYPNLVRLILKDLILNAISYCDVTSPCVRIDFVDEKDYVLLRVENNRIPSQEQLNQMNNPDLFVGQYGIQIILALKNALKWEMEIPTDYNEIKKIGKFYFNFKIPKML
jgi:hypothetical protein